MLNQSNTSNNEVCKCSALLSLRRRWESCFPGSAAFLIPYGYISLGAFWYSAWISAYSVPAWVRFKLDTVAFCIFIEDFTSAFFHFEFVRALAFSILLLEL
jgi:hypothetical protein